MRRLIAVSLIAVGVGPGFAGWAAPPDGAPPGGFSHGPVFISPMGEPFRTHATADTAPDLAWFQSVDTDHDGKITLAEFRASAARFFATLDVNKDGEIDPDELERYETEVAPEVRMAMGDMGGGGGPGGGGGMRHGRGGGHGGSHGGMGGGGPMGGGEMGGDGRMGGGDGDAPGGGGRHAGMPEIRRGAGRFGYFDLPEPVAAADSNLNRGVSLKEFDDAAIHRFALLDTAHNGYLSRDTLPKLERQGAARHHGGSGPPPDPAAEDYTG